MAKKIVPKPAGSLSVMRDPPIHAAHGPKTILLVEDEEMQREMLGLILTEKGYHVITAQDGVEAVEVYRSLGSSISLVILDIGLPRQGGEEVFRLMKQINPSARVVFATGYQDRGLQARVMESGASAFLSKPFKPVEILQVVKLAIEKKP
jgi:two-component system, cell cycle sensor histidine kinase and response regulator CckA